MRCPTKAPSVKSARNYAGMAGNRARAVIAPAVRGRQLGDPPASRREDGSGFELDGNDELAESVPVPVVAEDGAAPKVYDDDTVEVVLLDTPLLLHAAWQEHAEGLLREYNCSSASTTTTRWKP